MLISALYGQRFISKSGYMVIRTHKQMGLAGSEAIQPHNNKQRNSCCTGYSGRHCRIWTLFRRKKICKRRCCYLRQHCRVVCPGTSIQMDDRQKATVRKIPRTHRLPRPVFLIVFSVHPHICGICAGNRFKSAISPMVRNSPLYVMGVGSRFRPDKSRSTLSVRCIGRHDFRSRNSLFIIPH